MSIILLEIRRYIAHIIYYKIHGHYYVALFGATFFIILMKRGRANYLYPCS